MKDYSALKTKINESHEITSKDITELGYSRYDINQFIEAGIISRVKKGLYTYNERVVEETPEEIQQTEEINPLSPEEIYNIVKEGYVEFFRHNTDAAIVHFKKAISLDSQCEKARMGIYACNIFSGNLPEAVNSIMDFYNNRINDYLVPNVYYGLILLSKLTPVAEEQIDEVREVYKTTKAKKNNSNFKKMCRSIEAEDYLEALKYANYTVKLDKEKHRFYVTNHIFRYLIIAVLKALNITQEPLEDRQATPEEVIIIPEVKTEEIIKQNLLLEAINGNDYEKALAILTQENITNPVEIIRVLLTKLSSIQSIVTSNVPLKVTNVEEVTLVDENQLALTGFNEQQIEFAMEDTPKEIETPPTSKAISEELTEPSQTPISDDIPTLPIQNEEPSKEDLIEIAYNAYKEAYEIDDFQAARTNLRRYEYLNNTNGTHRNVNYHFCRINQDEEDYEQDPENYSVKKALLQRILELKKNGKYEESFELLTEYKTLPGIKHHIPLIVEAEILYSMKKAKEALAILNFIPECEEPSFYMLMAKIHFFMSDYQTTIDNCIAFNERRPNSSPTIYNLMGDAYIRLNKPGKARKAYTKADELYKAYNNPNTSMASKIAKAEARSEYKKEERLIAQTLKKNKK